MIIKELESITVKYLSVESESVTEQDAFKYYKQLGYNVFHDYSFYIKGLKYNKETGHYKFTGGKQEKVERNSLIKLAPRVNTHTISLFKRYKTGYPDLLLEKNGEVFFVEVKTTDTLSPHQVLFILELSKHEEVEVNYFLPITGVLLQMGKNRLTKSIENKKLAIANEKTSPVYAKFDKELDKLYNMMQKNSYKPYWVVAKLFKTFMKEVFDERNLTVIENKLKLSRAPIVMFIRNNAKDIIRDNLNKLKTTKSPSEKVIKDIQMCRMYLANIESVTQIYNRTKV